MKLIFQLSQSQASIQHVQFGKLRFEKIKKMKLNENKKMKFKVINSLSISLKLYLIL